MTDTVECPNCGETYTSLGGHWSKSQNCEHPQLTQEQRDVATGLVLGDGTVTRNYKNCIVQVKLVNKEYLEYLSNKFGPVGLGVKLHKTADEQAEMNRESGFSPIAEGENYQDVYRWMTRAHPYFNRYRSWYSDGEKKFPRNISISPSLLKTWYVCDGDLHDSKYIRIASSTQELERLSLWFDGSPIPTPKTSGHRIYWSTSDSKEVFDYMGQPPPGFGYKWID